MVTFGYKLTVVHPVLIITIGLVILSETKKCDSQWAHHGQTTLKQRCIDVTDVDTTLFRCRLAMMPAGKQIKI